MTLWAHEDAEYIHGSTANEAIQSFLEDQEEGPGMARSRGRLVPPRGLHANPSPSGH